MARFIDAIETVLAHEGGYVNDPNDRGGETNFGISKRKYPNVDIAALTRHGAIEIYRRDYWLPIYNEIESQTAATKVFDLAVNTGHRRAHQLAQWACCDAGRLVRVDGLFGPRTLEAVNYADHELFVKLLIYRAVGFYRDLARSPSQRGFLYSWVARVYD